MSFVYLTGMAENMTFKGLIIQHLNQFITLLWITYYNYIKLKITYNKDVIYIKKYLSFFIIFLIGIGFMCVSLFASATSYSIIHTDFFENFSAILYFLGYLIVVVFGLLTIITAIVEVLKGKVKK